VSTRTPPGWYPDPGHAGFGTAQERWWDGGTWTDHTRPSPSAPAPPAGFGQPAVPQQPPPPGRPKGPLVATAVAAVAVVLAVVVGVVVATRDDEDKRADGGPSPTAPSGSPRAEESTGPDDGSGGDPGPRQNRPTMASGVKLPLLSGWTRVEGTYGAAVNTTPYTCPLKRERCVRAGAAVYVTPLNGDPESVAEADIATNAERSYGADYYGGVTSHEEVESKAVKVAGQDGYLVRWKIDNKENPDAYVESVAFPHPDGSGQMLVLRAGVDIHDDAPPPSVLEKLVAGLEKGSVVDDGSSEQI
jgi:hypothetical protein